MPRVILAPAIARWLTATPGASVSEVTLWVEGSTVRDVLAAVFAIHPQIQSYIVDEHGALRHHVAAWLDGQPVTDKQRLQTTVQPDGELHLFQALSGG